MDELFSILLLIGIGIVSSRLKTKKAQQKTARKMNAFDEAAESMQEGKKSVNREILAQFMPELLEEDEIIEPAPSAKPVQPVVKSAEPLVKPAAPIVKPAAPIPKPVKAPAPLLFMDHDEPEGTVSTQGESPEEHARHRQKILAEEEKMRMDHEALQEIRHMNLQRLRTAVVMSEILDKPVSLRRRRT